jgi:hypothetical protein
MNRKMIGEAIYITTLIGNDFNSNSELQITIKKNMILPCPKREENVTHALSEAHRKHCH